jgi:hypothetical protein
MGYLVERVFKDDAGHYFLEHRPGWIRRTDAPTDPQTEHPIKPDHMRMLIRPGIYIIEEDPV